MNGVPWRKWGPYLSERQWGTVREDYSSNGDSWNYFTHDHARSRTYRWGEDGIAGFCDDVTVYVTGDVYATSCRGGQPKELGRGRLTADQLKQVFAWVDDLRNFEIGHEGPVAPDELIIRMVFSSAGAREASDADKQAIQDFAAELVVGFSK